MNRFLRWFRGLVVTIDIYLFNRELYHDLTQPLNMSDFEEVGPPE